MFMNVRWYFPDGRTAQSALRRARPRHSRRTAPGVGWWDCQPMLRHRALGGRQGRVRLPGRRWATGALRVDVADTFR